MPKFRLNEIYNPTSVARDSISNAVYIPCKGVEGKTVEPKLFQTYAQLKRESDYDTSTLSYTLARNLLDDGLEVLLEAVEEENITKKVPEFTPDTYYINVAEPGQTAEYEVLTTQPENWGTANTFYTKDSEDNYSLVVFNDEVVSSSPVIDFKRLQDKSLYDYRFITFGGYDGVKDSTIQSAIECANKRKDVVVCIDNPKDVDSITANEEYNVDTVTAYVGKVRTYFENLLEQFTATQLSYTDLLSPYVKLRLTEISSNVEVTNVIECPGTFGYLFALAEAVKNGSPIWYAMAGSFRGVSRRLVGVVYEYSNAEIEVLQGRGKLGEVDLDDVEDNVGIAINPIADIRPFGYIVWGNRTGYRNDGETNYRSFLNVRQLVSSIAKQCYIASRKYTFEPNSDVLWTNWKSMITPLLDKMQSGLGITGYKIIRKETDKKARLCAKIVIRPVEAVEDFDIDIELTDTLEIIE